MSEMNLIESYGELVKFILTDTVVKVTKFFTEDSVIRATRRTYGKRIRKRGPLEVLFTVGKPNYEERKVIKSHLKKSTKFPYLHFKMYFPSKKK